MVTFCSVKGCKSRAGQGIRFHSLPKTDIREAWITFLKKYNPLFMPTSRSTNVCELHFLSDLDYEMTPTSVYQTGRLKKNAVPSIMYKNTQEPLFHKPFQKLNIFSDDDAYEEEVVTLSPSDILEKPLIVPFSVQNSNIVSPKPTVQNTNTIESAVQFMHAVSSTPNTQNFDEIKIKLSTLVQNTIDKEFRINNTPKPTEKNTNFVLPKPTVKNTNIVTSKPTVQNTNTNTTESSVQLMHAVSPTPNTQNVNEVKLPVLGQNTVEKKFKKNNNRKYFMGDFNHPSDIDSPNNRLKYWIASQAAMKKQKKKIKLMYKQTVVMRKKINKLNSLIDNLKNVIKMDSKNGATTLEVISTPDKQLAATNYNQNQVIFFTHKALLMESTWDLFDLKHQNSLYILEFL